MSHYIGECAHHPAFPAAPRNKRPHVFQEIHVRVALSVDEERGVTALTPAGTLDA